MLMKKIIRENQEGAIASPFRDHVPQNRTVSLATLTFSLVFFAGVSLVIMFAARVPLIANSIHDFLGLPRLAKPEKPDRTPHLVFLLFCYASPLLLALWISLIQWSYKYFAEANLPKSRDPDSPFA